MSLARLAIRCHNREGGDEPDGRSRVLPHRGAGRRGVPGAKLVLRVNGGKQVAYRKLAFCRVFTRRFWQDSRNSHILFGFAHAAVYSTARNQVEMTTHTVTRHYWIF